MKTLVWEGPKVMNIRDQAEAPLAAGEIRIKVAYAGICGSELSSFLGHNALRVPPVVMGHEFSGTIVDLGAEAQAHNPDLAAGQAVTVNPLTWCGTCEYCQQGLNHLCRNRALVGAHRPGAYAEYVNVPAELALPLPQGMPLRTGALVEPVAVGVRIGELAGPVADQDALVIGAGPIGLLALQALQAKGARRVFIGDLSPERLAMGADLGGEALDPQAVDLPQAVREATGGRGVAVSVDAVGLAVTRKQCVTATRSAGTMILSGLHEEVSAMPAADIIRREIIVRGCFAYAPDNFREALRRLAAGTVRLAPWIAEAPLAEGGRWFQQLIDAPGKVAKVLLVP
jgi:threonine dehydrogenase-like Zn-dependent dehydrogenase